MRGDVPDDGPPAPSPVPVPLRALGGAAASPELARDLLKVLDFPPAARQRLWSVLGPCLIEKVPPAMEAELERFERSFALPPDSLACVLRAFRVLVRAAALRGLDAAALAADALDLTGREEPGQILAQGYEAARAVVRRVATRAALATHGAVLDGVDWRIDHVGASSRRDGLQYAFAVLTLHYEEEGRAQRLTLQVTPETLLQLETACRTILHGPGSSGSSPAP